VVGRIHSAGSNQRTRTSRTTARAAGAADPKTLPPPKHAVIPKLAGPVKIDGELDEAVWGKAVVLEPFFQNEGSAGPELEHTQVRLWYDDAALYLGWKCMDADIHATFTNRDSHFWRRNAWSFSSPPRR